ncbi:MAG: hypothetical protein ACYDG4_14790 [Desulfuromonadaceae bacterium]
MKSFKEYLMEAPSINSYFDKALMRELSASRAKYILQQSKDPNYHLDERGYHHYFDKGVDGNIANLYVVDRDNREIHASKVDGGDSKKILEMMRSHVEKHGVLFSDISHTKGTKKLWQDFAKLRAKGIGLFVNNTKTSEREEVSYFDDSLWGRNRNEHVVLELRYGHR